MGSTGSGNFSDYSGASSGIGGKSGGSSNENKCEKAFTASLEEVERCAYFVSNKDVPEVGDELAITFDGRLAAVNNQGLVVGYLPTKYNYIKSCIDEGYSYSARVVNSINVVVASVTVDVFPI